MNIIVITVKAISAYFKALHASFTWYLNWFTSWSKARPCCNHSLHPFSLHSVEVVARPLLDSCHFVRSQYTMVSWVDSFAGKLPDYSSSFLLFLLASSACRMSSTLLSLSVGNRDFRVLFLD